MALYFLFIIVGSIRILTAFVMAVWFKSNRIINIYLTLICTATSFYLVFHGLFHLQTSNLGLISSYQFNYFQVALVLVPCLYIYFEKLKRNVKFFEKRDILHLCLPIFFVFKVSNKSYFDFNHYFLIFIFLLIFSIIYFYNTYFLIKSILEIEEKVNSKEDFKILKDWLLFLFFASLGLFLIAFLSQLIGLINLNYNCILLLDYFILFICLSVSLKILFTPEIFYGKYTLLKNIKNIKSSGFYLRKVWKTKLNSNHISDKDFFLYSKINPNILDYFNQIDELALNDFVFRKPNYTLFNLSKDLGIPKYYLDFIFKYYCEVSFNDYKKIVRIFDAVQLICTGFLKTNTLDSLARYVGFSSYNPFLINFKDCVGVPPFEFNKNRRISRSSFIYSH